MKLIARGNGVAEGGRVSKCQMIGKYRFCNGASNFMRIRGEFIKRPTGKINAAY
jgi:hypothetical protein